MSAVFERAAEVVARHTGVPQSMILERRLRLPCPRSAGARLAGMTPFPPELAFARQAAMYLAVVAGDMPVKRFARIAGRHPWVVTKAVRAIEDARDDAEIDAQLARFEEELAS